MLCGAAGSGFLTRGAGCPGAEKGQREGPQRRSDTCTAAIGEALCFFVGLLGFQSSNRGCPPLAGRALPALLRGFPPKTVPHLKKCMPCGQSWRKQKLRWQRRSKPVPTCAGRFKVCSLRAWRAHHLLQFVFCGSGCVVFDVSPDDDIARFASTNAGIATALRLHALSSRVQHAGAVPRH